MESQATATQIHEFSVAMTCTGCSGAVERVLGKLGEKIEKVNIDLDKRIVEVTSSLPSSEILAVIQKTGKESKHLSSRIIKA